jgi:hypothetical protein
VIDPLALALDASAVGFEQPAARVAVRASVAVIRTKRFMGVF